MSPLLQTMNNGVSNLAVALKGGCHIDTPSARLSIEVRGRKPLVNWLKDLTR